MDYTDPRPLRWTAEDYYRLGETDLFWGRRVQLIGGEIVEMASQTNWHALGISKTMVALMTAFGPGFWVRPQMSLDLSPNSVPDPDIAVIAGGMLTHRRRANPTTALLVVEVSDTSLRYDTTTKASLYAASGITDYWVLNIPDNQLEVYRDPVPDAGQPFGSRYDQCVILGPADHVAPLALPGASIPVSDVQP